MRLLLTIRNCIKLRTLRHFKLLYNEVDIPVNRDKRKNRGCIRGSNLTLLSTEIVIGKCESKIILDTILLHEVGHLVDFNKKVCYPNYRANRSRKNNQRIEKQAWKEGIRLADKYETKLCYESAKSWLSTYGTQYAVINNRI